jgi:hypothetical protein
VLREFAMHAGARRVENGTLLAIRAVIARKYFANVYRTDKDAWSAHKASGRTFASWKRALRGFRAYRVCSVPKTAAAREELNLGPSPEPTFDFQKDLMVSENAMQRFCKETKHVDMNEETSSDESNKSSTPELEARAIDMYSYELTPVKKKLMAEIEKGLQ